MKTVASLDGTSIAFERGGEGPPIIFVFGAFNDHSRAVPLASALQELFTTYVYDRRGRGSSGDNQPYAIQREIEDIDALISEAGGSALVFGHSSGATLALHAAASGSNITEMVLYEPPFLVDASRPKPPADLAERIAQFVSADRRGDAVELFQLKGVGLPEEVVVQLRNAPFRPRLETIAHTLVYDALITGDLSLPADLIGAVATPTLVVAGDASPSFMQSAARALADALPNGQLRMLPGQTHDIVPEATRPIVQAFFTGSTLPGA
jgi:pimeloyl-ACP methyl ester carboxylesterase